MKRVRVVNGDVVQIPLSNGRYAYGRVVEKGYGVFVYKTTSDRPNNPPIGEREYLEKFPCYIYACIKEHGWEKIGTDKFSEDEEDRWLPPTWAINAGHLPESDTEYVLYYKDEYLPATKEDIIGLRRPSGEYGSTIAEIVLDMVNGKENKYWKDEIMTRERAYRVSKK